MPDQPRQSRLTAPLKTFCAVLVRAGPKKPARPAGHPGAKAFGLYLYLYLYRGRRQHRQHRGASLHVAMESHFCLCLGAENLRNVRVGGSRRHSKPVPTHIDTEWGWAKCSSISHLAYSVRRSQPHFAVAPRAASRTRVHPKVIGLLSHLQLFGHDLSGMAFGKRAAKRCRGSPNGRSPARGSLDPAEFQTCRSREPFQLLQPRSLRALNWLNQDL